ncbi:hypothetical protein V7149_21460 [Bacillus sp. JJ1503]|uniref:hypothetical protein n=1 Tax=Bacillus sp. JJ1503 TaxID=3122956 RepID=UPI002FFF2706
MWEKIKGIDIALYIFILTGLGYLITFLYEWGYNYYYSLPIEFIELTVSNITKSLVMICIIFGLGYINNLFLHKETDFNRLIKKTLLPSVQVQNSKLSFFYQGLCVLGIALFAFHLVWNNPADKFLFYCLILIFIYFYSLLKKYKNLTLTLGIIFLLILPFYSGYFIAKQKQNYLFIDNEVVIRVYESKLITAKFDQTKNKITPDFKLHLIDNIADQDISLKMIKIKHSTIKSP